ncbi:hypothetical protein NE604_06345 [Anaerofustis stercorihominis]|uniref:Preprotein translocase subunit SecB n=1 Tax=Anaerofustis stercorihominis DSM 17244 TaxID=445971 RepID=B1CAN0_9FIRM|nr:hypothetical protein [Anaerofustis stercorihominis]EDS72503.1 hypothetical protein ANASTE_02225 [Anaerofustis stercorihominis DSM 17244]MCQ4795259.1 hypothetical protein [Anaerofustis stercorihominis]
MHNFVDYFEEDEVCDLTSVSFVSPEFRENLDFGVTDEIEILEANNKELIIDFTRTLVYENDDDVEPFLQVSATANFSVKDDFNDTIVLMSKTSDLENKILENEEFFLSSTISGVSLLISQVLSSFGKVPVITPPVFMSEDDEE